MSGLRPNRLSEMAAASKLSFRPNEDSRVFALCNTGKLEEGELNQVGKIMEILRHTLPDDYEYNFVDDHYDREETFRMKLTTQSEVKKWMNDLEQKSRTTWRVARTYAVRGRRNLLRLDFRCHHNTVTRRTRKGTGGVKTSKKGIVIVKTSKNTNCPATIKIRVKRYIEKSKAKHVDSLVKEWPCIINFNNKHNHSLQSASILKHRDMSEETKQKLLQLFHQGYSPTSALRCLKTDFYLENPEDYSRYECDGHYFPSLSVCHHLYNKEIKQQHGSRSREQILNDLKESLEKYSATTGGKAISGTTDSHSYICICTPLMRRAHTMIKESSEIVYVDAVSSMGRHRQRVYFLTTSTPAGGLPLGIIICDVERETTFNCALRELIDNCFPEKSFYGQNYPTVIITSMDIDSKERIPLQAHFANSAHLLCQFVVLKSMWSWLCKTTKLGNGIDKSDCEELFLLFKLIVYSKSEDKLHMAFQQLTCENEVARKYPQYIKYVERYWEEKEAWASCYRYGLPIWGKNATDYGEVSFRISKDSILEKAVTFNLAQLVDFFLTRYESYIEKQLVSFSQGCLQKYLLHGKSTIPLDAIVEHKTETRSDCFTVPSETEENVSYSVDISKCTCECSHGNAISICKHISAVLDRLKRDSVDIAGESTLLSRIIMYQVATGKEPDRKFLLSLSSGVPSEAAPPQVQQVPDVERTQSQQSCPEVRQVSEVTPTVVVPMTFVELYVSSPEEKENSRNHPPGSKQVIEDVKKLYDSIVEGLERNPDVFIPAATKMIHNVKRYVSTDAGLAAALYTFAENPAIRQAQNRSVAAVKHNNVTHHQRPRKHKLEDRDCTVMKMPETKRVKQKEMVLDDVPVQQTCERKIVVRYHSQVC